MTAPPVLLGLTGGIGSGKSTVATMLAQSHRAAIIDADAISRQTTAAGGSSMAQIAAAFGEQMIAADGALDRAAMRDLIYQNPNARQQLEAIVHPLVSEETDRQMNQALRDAASLIVFDIPLLAEAGPRWRARVHKVMVVDCDAETQTGRVMARNGLPREQVQSILAAQASRPQRLACADAVIFNGTGIDLAALRGQISDWAGRFGL